MILEVFSNPNDSMTTHLQAQLLSEHFEKKPGARKTETEMKGPRYMTKVVRI